MKRKERGAAQALLWPDAAGKLRRGLACVSEPVVLFPAIALLVLALVWGSTLHLIEVERSAAERTAAVSSAERADTYEAQVVRAVREIDLTLKFVKYAYEVRGRQAVLQELEAKSLLPPALLFVVTIVDRSGAVIASSKPSALADLDDQDYLRVPRDVDGLSIGPPPSVPGAGEGKMRFSRRLSAPDGTYAGMVTIAVDAAFFVSTYETSKLGRQGTLGIVGIDGVFQVRRTGDEMAAGDRLDYAALIPPGSQASVNAVQSISTWDGVARWTSARQLFEFPLAVVVGLSADEQLAAARGSVQAHLGRALLGSLVLIVIAAVLTRMSRQLAAGRQRVEYLAYHDGLTGLPNRSQFSKLLSQRINEAQRYGKRLAVMFLDLDRFKQINDTLGHDAGDQLLQEVAARLKACLRDSDTVARLGGDEFVVLLPELSGQTDVSGVAQKILSSIARPFMLLGQDFRVTVSIGVSSYPQDGLDEQTLTKNADIAMYQAKEEGKNNFQFYSETLNANSLERLTLESSLRHALERGEFELHYQAKHDIRSGRITGMEALLRWKHPDLGTIAPMQFIPLAEETGLIAPIGKWVLKTACEQNMAWQKQGLPCLSMAINLTARQFFDESLVPDLTAVLAATGMPARLLELEIAENLLMNDVHSSLGILSGLKAMGVRIAINDFGVGYSSLATLQQFPLDTIKIDRSFIRDVASADQDKALTGAIIAIGRTLSLTVVAQGVETKAQADFLRSNACDELQGFYLDLPMPADRVTDLLHNSRDDAARDAAVPA